MLELLFLIKANDSKWMVLPAGLCVGLAFLAKSWHAFWMFPATLLLLIVSGMLPRFSARHVFGYFLAAFAPIALWAAARYAADGPIFFKTMIEYDLLARSGTALEGHHGGPEYYIKVLLLTPSTAASGLILISGAIAALAGKGRQDAFARIKAKDSRFTLGVLSWTLAPLVLFSAMSTKLVWYVFPCVPALFFIAAYVAPHVWSKAMEAVKARMSFGTAAPAVCLTAAVAFTAVGAFVSYRNTQTIDVNPEQDLLESAYAAGDLPRGAEFYFGDGKAEAAPQGVIARAELSGDAYPLVGGVGAFASTDSPAVLLIDVSSASDSKDKLPADATLVGKTDQFLLYENSK